MNALATKLLMAHAHMALLPSRIRDTCRRREDGQGTVEYAILVGVLAVIAIIAIVAFKGKVQELWDAIKDGMAKL